MPFFGVVLLMPVGVAAADADADAETTLARPKAPSGGELFAKKKKKKGCLVLIEV